MAKEIQEELSKISSKRVEDFLREVDYSELAKYKPKDFSLNFINFIKAINGPKGESNISPPMHYKMLDTFAYSKARNVVNLCARGIGKTTLFGEYLILYLAVFNTLPCIKGDITTIIYLADSKDNGAKNLSKNIQARLERSDVLQNLIKAKITQDELEFTNIHSKKKLNVMLYGAKTGFRGTKRQGDRPQLAILDDLMTDSDATSQIVLNSISETIYSGIFPALDSNPGRSKIIFNGTPFSKVDPIYTAVESGRWEVNVYPICETFPVDEKDFKGAWEDKFDYQYVLDKYLDLYSVGKGASFKKEYMLSIASEEDRLVLDSDIRWYSIHTVLEKLDKYTVFITTDFATSDKSTGDLSVILVWAFDYLGNRYLLDGVAKQQSMLENIEHLFRFCQKYNPLSVGVEINGQQKGFIAWLKQEMVRRHIFFNFATKQDAKGSSNSIGIPVTKNKKARFELTVIQFKNGKVFFPLEHKFDKYLMELIDEISSVTTDGIKARHDDGIDAISQLDQFYCPLPSQEEFFLEDTSYIDKTAKTEGLDDYFEKVDETFYSTYDPSLAESSYQYYLGED